MVEQRVSMAGADPYLLFGLLGKQVIHPGGRKATEELFGLAGLGPGQRVLDIGCGVGTTAIEMATRFAATVTAADISPDMRDRALANVRTAGVSDKVAVEAADICALPFPNRSFDGRQAPRPARRSSGRCVLGCSSTPSRTGWPATAPPAWLTSRSGAGHSR